MKKDPEIIIENVEVPQEDLELFRDHIKNLFKSFDLEEISRKAG